MISTVVYGRNDQHGYNSHRRVALSLNAMAEVLTGPDDEILFVDYHTPHGMPTLPEAIEDTLTDRAIDLMRVLRVTPEMHMAAVGDRSRLPISEPHARNVAIRRARPGNWILSTNTDMVFVPRGEKSLTDLVAELDGDAYCLPRFEIPEWLWEAVPRNDPQQMIHLLRDWGERIGLDEVTLGHEWILYDAPGDFQLLRRSLIEEIHGFDERMIHGWHVDSNLWKRVHNRLGAIGSLYPDVAAYHTNHNRSHTVHTSPGGTGNDVHTFFYEVEGWSVSSQAEKWGLVEFDVPEVRLGRPDLPRLLRAASSRGAGQTGPLITSDTRESLTVLAYDARHVLPFVLDPIVAATPTPTVGYVGLNDSTVEMLEAALMVLGGPDQVRLGNDAAAHAKLVILDLGVDASTGREPLTRAEADALTEALESAHTLLLARVPAPSVILINGSSGVWDAWVRDRFDTLYGTFHARVQGAAVKRESTDTAMNGLAFATRDRQGVATCSAGHPEPVLELKAPSDFAGVDDGWANADDEGILLWRALGEVRFQTVGSIQAGAHVMIQMACWTTRESAIELLEIEIRLDGSVIFEGRVAPIPQILNIHGIATDRGAGVHTLAVRASKMNGDPYLPYHSGGLDPWVRLEAVRVASHETDVGSLREVVRMHPGSLAEAALRGPWTKTNPFGAWSVALGSGICITGATAEEVAMLELMGHPLRDGQSVRITATGDGEVVTDIRGLAPNVPEFRAVPLPAPNDAGEVHLAIEPIDAPAPTGEVVEVRAIGVVMPLR